MLASRVQAVDAPALQPQRETKGHLQENTGFIHLRIPIRVSKPHCTSCAASVRRVEVISCSLLCSTEDRPLEHSQCPHRRTFPPSWNNNRTSPDKEPKKRGFTRHTGVYPPLSTLRRAPRPVARVVGSGEKWPIPGSSTQSSPSYTSSSQGVSPTRASPHHLSVQCLG